MGTVTELRLKPPSERPRLWRGAASFLTRRSALMAFVTLAMACVHQDKVPPLTGPSEFGQSVTITATPDSISQDGASQSAIVVLVRGPNGAGASGVPLRLEIAVGGVVQDFGRLSAKNIVTDSNGRATAIYFAPPAPPPLSNGSSNIVTIVVRATDSNFDTSIPQTVDIRLVRTGVILPPGETPRPSFTFSPSPASVNAEVRFDASASCAGSDPCTSTAGITSFQWNFGDGTTATGVTATKTFTTASSYPVTLTVTNDRAFAASTTQTVSVDVSDAPTVDFSISPPSPVVREQVQFNASASRPADGRTITRYAWNWGDGDPVVSGTGPLQDHDFQRADTFAVTLTVTDDVGQSRSVSRNVTVGTGAPVVVITFSPTSPTPVTTVNFNSDGTTYHGGTTPIAFLWTFGDGFTSTLANPTHSYALVGTYSVRLSVTDSLNRTGTSTATVTVAAVTPPTPPAPPVASFTFGPPSPAAGVTNVLFDGSGSTGSNLTYTWNFGDGNTAGPSGAPTVNHVYAVAGPYSATLTVRDTVTMLSNTSAAQTVTVVP